MKKIILLFLFPIQSFCFNVVEIFPMVTVNGSHIQAMAIEPKSKLPDSQIMKFLEDRYDKFRVVYFTSNNAFTTISIETRGEVYTTTFVYARNKNQFSFYVVLIGRDGEAITVYRKFIQEAVKNNWID